MYNNEQINLVTSTNDDLQQLPKPGKLVRQTNEYDSDDITDDDTEFDTGINDVYKIDDNYFGLDNIINTHKFYTIFGNPTNIVIDDYLDSIEYFKPIELCNKISKIYITNETLVNIGPFESNVSTYIRLSECFAIALEYTGKLKHSYMSDEDLIYVSKCLGLNFTTNGSTFREIMDTLCKYPERFKFD